MQPSAGLFCFPHNSGFRHKRFTTDILERKGILANHSLGRIAIGLHTSDRLDRRRRHHRTGIDHTLDSVHGGTQVNVRLLHSYIVHHHVFVCQNVVVVFLTDSGEHGRDMAQRDSPVHVPNLVTVDSVPSIQLHVLVGGFDKTNRSSVAQNHKQHCHEDKPGRDIHNTDLPSRTNLFSVKCSGALFAKRHPVKQPFDPIYTELKVEKDSMETKSNTLAHPTTTVNYRVRQARTKIITDITKAIGKEIDIQQILMYENNNEAETLKIQDILKSVSKYIESITSKNNVKRSLDDPNLDRFVKGVNVAGKTQRDLAALKILLKNLKTAEKQNKTGEQNTTKQKISRPQLGILYRDGAIIPTRAIAEDDIHFYQWEVKSTNQPWFQIKEKTDVVPEMSEGFVRLVYNGVLYSNAINIRTVINRQVHNAKRTPHRFSFSDSEFQQRCYRVARRIAGVYTPRENQSTGLSMLVFQDRVSRLPEYMTSDKTMNVQDILHLCQHIFSRSGDSDEDSKFVHMVEFCEPTIRLNPASLTRKLKQIYSGHNIILSLDTGNGSERQPETDSSEEDVAKIERIAEEQEDAVNFTMLGENDSDANFERIAKEAEEQEEARDDQWAQEDTGEPTIDPQNNLQEESDIIENAFNFFDRNRDSSITLDEFRIQWPDMKKDVLAQLINGNDLDHNGSISLEEWKIWCVGSNAVKTWQRSGWSPNDGQEETTELTKEAENAVSSELQTDDNETDDGDETSATQKDEDLIQQYFNIFDENGNNEISDAEFKKQWPDMKKDVLAQLINGNDLDHNGSISLEEWKIWCVGSNAPAYWQHFRAEQDGDETDDGNETNDDSRDQTNDDSSDEGNLIGFVVGETKENDDLAAPTTPNTGTRASSPDAPTVDNEEEEFTKFEQISEQQQQLQEAQRAQEALDGVKKTRVKVINGKYKNETGTITKRTAFKFQLKLDSDKMTESGILPMVKHDQVEYLDSDSDENDNDNDREDLTNTEASEFVGETKENDDLAAPTTPPVLKKTRVKVINGKYKNETGTITKRTAFKFQLKLDSDKMTESGILPMVKHDQVEYLDSDENDNEQKDLTNTEVTDDDEFESKHEWRQMETPPINGDIVRINGLVGPVEVRRGGHYRVYREDGTFEKSRGLNPMERPIDVKQTYKPTTSAQSVPSGELTAMLTNMSSDWATSEDELNFAEDSANEFDEDGFAETSSGHDTNGLTFAETSSGNDASVMVFAESSDKMSSALEFAESSDFAMTSDSDMGQ